MPFVKRNVSFVLGGSAGAGWSRQRLDGAHRGLELTPPGRAAGECPRFVHDFRDVLLLP